MQREADVVKVAALCVMSPDQISIPVTKPPPEGVAKEKKNRIKVSLFYFQSAMNMQLELVPLNRGVDGTDASPFQASCESTPGSVSMPA